MKLVNNTNTALNEEIFSRIFLKKFKNDIKDLPVVVTVISYNRTNEDARLRNGSDAKEFNTTHVDYRCELLLKVGENTQTIKRQDSWAGRMGSIALAPPTDEELIVDLISEHFDKHFDKKDRQ
ncbi:hypothetical protein GZH53_06315 [Flavihumibacter sp. R14]|nr:hypothetical protein [Flavihumibacter soli]